MDVHLRIFYSGREYTLGRSFLYLHVIYKSAVTTIEIDNHVAERMFSTYELEHRNCIFPHANGEKHVVMQSSTGMAPVSQQALQLES